VALLVVSVLAKNNPGKTQLTGLTCAPSTVRFIIFNTERITVGRQRRTTLTSCNTPKLYIRLLDFTCNI